MGWLYRHTLGRFNDLNALVSLHFTLQRLGWNPPAFFTDGAAGSPTLQLALLKYLLLTHPTAVLELGSGQTSKMLSCYQRDHPDAYVLTLEEDRAFADVMRPFITHDYRHAPLNPWYDVPTDRAFDIVLLDGPSNLEKRIGIAAHLPRILSPSFILLLDDTEDRAMRPTLAACDSALQQTPHLRFQIDGWKQQTVFCAPQHRFLAYS
jgi:hypothetical protein